MSATVPCQDKEAHRHAWVVTMRHCNYSAFDGYKRTPSRYSEVRCPLCRAKWRTTAAYVNAMPDAPVRTTPPAPPAPPVPMVVVCPDCGGSGAHLHSGGGDLCWGCRGTGRVTP